MFDQSIMKFQASSIIGALMALSATTVLADEGYHYYSDEELVVMSCKVKLQLFVKRILQKPINVIVRINQQWDHGYTVFMIN